jgi:hypothetical protein
LHRLTLYAGVTREQEYFFRLVCDN